MQKNTAFNYKIKMGLLKKWIGLKFLIFMKK